MCITYTNYGHGKDFHLEIKLVTHRKLNKNLISIAHFGIRCKTFYCIKGGGGLILSLRFRASERGNVADVLGKN